MTTYLFRFRHDADRLTRIVPVVSDHLATAQRLAREHIAALVVTGRLPCGDWRLASTTIEQTEVV